MKIWHAVFFLVALISVAQSAYYYPRLPDTLASNFDGSGVPGGWTTKPSFLLVHLGMVAVLFLMFECSARFLRRIPPALMNVPHRDHGLSPEFREQTHDWIERRLIVMGIATLVFMIVVFGLAMHANLVEPVRLPMAPFWTALAVYFAFSAGWTIGFFVRFRAPRVSRA
jgi:uncharacterized membrane protein